MAQGLPWGSPFLHHSLGHILRGLGLALQLLGFLSPGYGGHELLLVLQMPMAELLVSHGASLSARTSMDEMPIGKAASYLVHTYLPVLLMVSGHWLNMWLHR